MTLMTEQRLRRALELIEAAYEPAGDVEGWLSTMSARLAALAGVEIAAAHLTLTGEAQPEPGALVGQHGLAPGWKEAAIRSSRDSAPLEKWIERTWTGPAVFFNREHGELDPDDAGQAPLFAVFAAHGISDQLSASITDGGAPLSQMMVFATGGRQFGREDVRLVSRVYPHLSAGARLQRARRVASPPAEAVITPDGRVAHAEGPAAAPVAREMLVEAVRAVERTRGAAGWRDPEEALRVRRALVAGRWSLAECHEENGRRYILAVDNRHRSRGVLPPEVEAVALLVARGCSDRFIAAELGLSAATVARRLAAARSLLGVSTRYELAARMLGVALAPARERAVRAVRAAG